MAVKERSVDHTKSSNRKCNYCKHWRIKESERVDSRGNTCAQCDKTKTEKKYYNRCKEFEWRDDED